MRQLVLNLILILAFASISAQDTITIKNFDWFIGNWEMKQGELLITEHWEYGENKSLQGHGYVIKGKDTLVRETMKIEKVGKYWVFIAQINNNNPVLFTLKAAVNTKELVFENIEHDSPHRVIYISKKENELYASTETETKGLIKKDEYIYKRL